MQVKYSAKNVTWLNIKKNILEILNSMAKIQSIVSGVFACWIFNDKLQIIKKTKNK